jgi:hypothetical protein
MIDQGGKIVEITEFHPYILMMDVMMLFHDSRRSTAAFKLDYLAT